MIFIKTLITFLRDEDYRDLLWTTLAVIGMGTVVYHHLEGWSWINSIYFSVITLTTIGYGDYSPQTEAGKLFTIFYIIIGIGMILTFVNTVYNHYAHLKTEEKNKEESSRLQ